MLMRAVSEPINHALEGLEQILINWPPLSTISPRRAIILQTVSSQQAAWVEQTSSSLEEMSSMTLQNAKNAHPGQSIDAGNLQVVSIASPMAQLLLPTWSRSLRHLKRLQRS